MSREPGEEQADSLAIDVRGVRKRFGYREVLKGVSLRVPRGTCFVLSGPNGAGKSTLLRIVATQWTFHAGHVRVLGTDVRRLTGKLEARARLGAVFHESFLRPELSLEENLQYAASLHRLRWAQVAERAEELSRRFGLQARLRDRVTTFSEGMIKRANVVRSLLHEPDLWILDEPFAGLDWAGRELLESVVKDYCTSGHTVFMVTHLAELRDRMATSSALVDGGRLVDPSASDTVVPGAPSPTGAPS